ncbi:hypothetical protein ARMSODRAFT_564314 [Armillaria solidipes]|uniref:Uncharacterized protein n=1 Tax=Armillaria solidipes TaxID=1076256 RepID=A0A2H3CF43_9AGAR|nr:hypothetical protein ARMSODRAFT_564314 [Armillaria solidipes]
MNYELCPIFRYTGTEQPFWASCSRKAEAYASCLGLSWSDLLDRSEVFSGNRRKGFLDIPILSRLRCRSRSPSLHRNRTRRRQVRQHPHLLYGSKLALITALPSMLTAKVSDFEFCVLDATARDLTVGARGNVQLKTPETLYGAPRSLRKKLSMTVVFHFPLSATPTFRVFSSPPKARLIPSSKVMSWRLRVS